MIARQDTIAKAIQALEPTNCPAKAECGGQKVPEGEWMRQKKKNLARLNRLLGVVK